MNNKFKKCLLLFSAVMLIVCMAHAQNQNSNWLQNEQFALQLRTAEARMGQRIEMLTKRLSLSPEQLDKVKKIERHNLEEELRTRERASMGNDMKGMQKNTGGGPGFNPSLEQRSLNYDFIRLRKEADDEVAKLLNEKQKIKFAELRLREEKIREDRQMGLKPQFQGNKTQSNKKRENVPAKKKAKEPSTKE